MLTASVTVASTTSFGPSAGLYQVLFNVQVLESDVNLTDQLISAKINLGDGIILNVEGDPSRYVGSFDGREVYKAEIVSQVQHNYRPGNYAVKIDAINYRRPKQDTATAIQQLTLAAPKQAYGKTPIIFGPILPSDTSFPNKSQWNLNLDKDIKLLASSVKMILITDVGERSMLNAFGSNLKALLFEPSSSTTAGQIESEVRRAINTWEPRVIIDSVQIVRKDREASVNVALVSILNKQRFELSVDFVA